MFLDGVADEELPAQMLSLLNWPGVVDQVSSFVFLVACVKIMQTCPWMLIKYI